MYVHKLLCLNIYQFENVVRSFSGQRNSIKFMCILFCVVQALLDILLALNVTFFFEGIREPLSLNMLTQHKDCS